jgi:methylated-DNA-[protein]-cysteine S-methyltransferase
MKQYHLFKTSFGWCALFFRQDPLSVVEILLPKPRRALTEILAPAGDRASRLPEPARRLAGEIQDYFDHPPHPLSVPWELLDFSDMTELQRRVLETTAAISFGQTRSYSDIAGDVGIPRAARFVGNTMARNPFPIVVPCHRVVRADGSPGHFGGGTELKRRMLELEGVTF